MNLDKETLIEIQDYINYLDEKFGLKPETMQDIENAIGLAKSTEDDHIDLCRKLRIETGMGITLCKKCLVANNWNYEEAKKNSQEFRWNSKLNNQ